MERDRVFFKKFLSNELPGFEKYLDNDQISDLYNQFIDWEKYKRSAANCLSQHLNSVTKVDYTGDFERDMSIAALKGLKLQNSIKNIKKVYCIDTPVESNSNGKVIAQ